MILCGSLARVFYVGLDIEIKKFMIQRQMTSSVYSSGHP